MVTQTRDGFISARTYAVKYGITPSYARELYRTGKLKGYTLPKSGTRFGEGVFLEDVEARTTRCSMNYRDGKKRCPKCMAWLPEGEYTPSEWVRAKANCRCCNHESYLDRRYGGDPVRSLISASNRAAEIEKDNVLTDRQRAEREATVQAHAARIAAAGYAGDGEVFPDGE